MRLPASAPPKRSPGSERSARPVRSSSPTSPTNCSRNSPAGAAPSTPTPDQTRRPDLHDRQGASARPDCPRTGRCWSIGHKRISGQAAPAHPSGAHRLAARNPADTPDGTGPPVAANPTTRHRIYRSTLVHQPRDLTGLHDLIAIGTHPDPRTEPRPDLAARVRALLRLTTTSVPSCSGLRLTLTRDNLPVTVTALTLDAGLEPVRSSLAIRLPHNPLTNSTRPPPGRPPPGSPQPGSPPPGGELVLYASCRRAFQSVAVDLLTLLDLDPRRAVLDRHLHCPTWPTPPPPWPLSSTTAARSNGPSASCSPAAYPRARAGRNSPGVPPPTGTISLQPPVSSCATLPAPATGHAPGEHSRDP